MPASTHLLMVLQPPPPHPMILIQTSSWAAIRSNSSSVALTGAGAGWTAGCAGAACWFPTLPFAGCLIPALASASFTNELGISASLAICNVNPQYKYYESQNTSWVMKKMRSFG
jgi:hypothetical protein